MEIWEPESRRKFMIWSFLEPFIPRNFLRFVIFCLIIFSIKKLKIFVLLNDYSYLKFFSDINIGPLSIIIKLWVDFLKT